MTSKPNNKKKKKTKQSISFITFLVSHIDYNLWNRLKFRVKIAICVTNPKYATNPKSIT